MSFSIYMFQSHLLLGLTSVLLGQCGVFAYFWLGKHFFFATPIQTPPPYVFSEALVHHITRLEGLPLVGLYLVGTWTMGYLPVTYYSFVGGINWSHVALQLLIQDFGQYVVHRLQHKYLVHSHHPHHRFTHPKIFDAFDGSLSDTCLMILIPMTITCRLVPANGWSYMVFGSIYANGLTLIHSEYAHPWDPLFRMIGFGTPADHHMHHKTFRCNFGHLFMYWDRMFGTYQDGFQIKA